MTRKKTASDSALPQMPSFATIEVAQRNDVALVTLNRPDKHNAFDEHLIRELTHALTVLDATPSARAVVLLGAGESFCAGADLDWMREAVDWSEAENRDDAMMLAKMLKALHDIPCLTVALVEGAAMGGGAGIVAACDTAVAVEGTVFAFSEVKLGLTPATISPYVIEAIGPRHARALFATGMPFKADDAARIGLIDEVVKTSASLDKARDWLVEQVKLTAPGAVAAAKDLVRHVHEKHRKIDHDLMAETAERIAERRVSKEGQEGVRAFLERRKPGWTV